MNCLEARAERWPLREPFRISRGVKTHADVVVAEVRAGDHTGRGECVPYARYGETVDTVLAQLAGLAAQVAAGLDRAALQRRLPPGAARNALDCALWDLGAQQAHAPAWHLAALPPPRPLLTAFTISLDLPEAMGGAARREAHRPLLKLKLDGGTPLECVRAVREAAPRARLIVDANEAWTPAVLQRLLPALRALGVELIEQPLPAGEDDALAALERLVPIAADESCHVATDLDALRDRYDFVNVKLDKAGGLTAALELSRAARRQGFGVFVGCMVATSLGTAPAMLLAAEADVVDLDGPLLLAHDREGGVRERDGWLQPLAPGLWGAGRPGPAPSLDPAPLSPAE